MAIYKFEVADWQATSARDLAQASFEAQANAMGDDTGTLLTFEAISDSIDSLLGVLGTDATKPVYVSAQVTTGGGETSVNLGIRLTPPQ